MAFSSAAASAPSNDAWKAQAFLNFYITLKSGKRVKVGAIPLKTSQALHKALIEKLSDSEEAQKQFMNSLELNFQLVGKDTDVDLSF